MERRRKIERVCIRDFHCFSVMCVFMRIVKLGVCVWCVFLTYIFYSGNGEEEKDRERVYQRFSLFFCYVCIHEDCETWCVCVVCIFNLYFL